MPPRKAKLKKGTKRVSVQQAEIASKADLIALHRAVGVPLPLKREHANTLPLLVTSFHDNIEGKMSLPPAPWTDLLPASLKLEPAHPTPQSPELKHQPDPPEQAPVSPPRATRPAPRVYTPKTTLMQNVVRGLPPGPEKNAAANILSRSVQKTAQAQDQSVALRRLRNQKRRSAPLSESLAAQALTLNKKQRVELFAATVATAHTALCINEKVSISREGQPLYALPVHPEDRGQLFESLSGRVVSVAQELLAHARAARASRRHENSCHILFSPRAASSAQVPPRPP
jgi:hypothetical protein